jgi:hypothetical protein
LLTFPPSVMVRYLKTESITMDTLSHIGHLIEECLGTRLDRTTATRPEQQTESRVTCIFGHCSTVGWMTCATIYQVSQFRSGYNLVISPNSWIFISGVWNKEKNKLIGKNKKSFQEKPFSHSRRSQRSFLFKIEINCVFCVKVFIMKTFETANSGIIIQLEFRSSEFSHGFILIDQIHILTFFLPVDTAACPPQKFSGWKFEKRLFVSSPTHAMHNVRCGIGLNYSL